jgi:hypothetical protein
VQIMRVLRTVVELTAFFSSESFFCRLPASRAILQADRSASPKY